MKMKAVRIQLNGGLEARPVAMLVQVASQHDSTVYLESERQEGKRKEYHGNDEPWTGQRRNGNCNRPMALTRRFAVEDIAKLSLQRQKLYASGTGAF